MLSGIFARLREHYLLLGILVCAIMLRLPGIGFGLPLMLVADETPFPLAALKMLELHTLLPAHHLEAFSNILYYPPYLSYLFIGPFILVVGIQYLLWVGPATGFITHLLADLSPFFITARFITLTLGIATIFLVYRIARAAFKSETTALFASLLLTVSTAHVALSMVARHWVPVAFVLACILFLLTHERLTPGKRYGLALITTGVGMGISTICVLFLIPIALHFFVMGGWSMREALRSKTLWVAGVAAAVLALLPSFLYPRSNGFIADLTLATTKDGLSLLLSPVGAFTTLFPAEPVLVLLALVGVCFLAITHRRMFFFSVLWIALYSAIFFVLFRYETRFLLPLVLMFTLLGGYACARLFESRAGRIFVVCMLMIPLACALRVSWLAQENDTRFQARAWIERHLTASDRVIVYANIMRVPTTKEAIEELRILDPGALRKVDEAETTLDVRELPHALNIYSVNNAAFFGSLPTYAKTHRYTYLVIDPAFVAMYPERQSAFSTLSASGTEVASWKGLDPTTSLSASSFKDPFWRLFSGRSFGPDILVYRIEL